MKLLRIQTKLYGSPLLITKEGFNSIHSIIQNKIAGITNPFNDMDGEDNEDSGPYDMTIENGVATIPIQGPIGKKLSMLEQVCGACDIDVLREQIDLAITNPDCQVILFDVDSPGGSVEGVPELAEYIAEINKQKCCIAVCDGLCCSAAYYLVSGCSEIYAVGKTSTIGSIGVYSYLLDQSRMFKNAGIDPILIKAGDNKGECLPGLPIEKDTIARIQADIDYIFHLFTTHVKAFRSNVKASTMQGQAYFSEEALRLGLIDEIINNKSDLLSIR